MNSYSAKDLSKLKNHVGWYNMIPSIIWSTVNLVPISIFCYTMLEPKLFPVFLIISVLPIFFPHSFFNKMQLSNTTLVYKKLGVHIVNKVAQNGEIINGLIRKKFPGYKAVIYQRTSINRLLAQTYVFEKFHFIMFVFFSIITVYAVVQGNFLWAIAISFTNAAYNIYPNLLQQYIRLKLTLYNKKLKSNQSF